MRLPPLVALAVHRTVSTRLFTTVGARRRCAASVSLVVGVFEATTTPLHADSELADPQTIQSPPKAYDIELGGRAGYASAPIRGGANPFGLGFGGRFGVAFSGAYIGASVIDFVGASDVDVSYRALLYGFEAGYGVKLRAFGRTTLTLRPMVGVGNAVIYYTDPSLSVDVVTSASGGSSSRSDTISVSNIYVQPSLTMMLSAGGHFAALAANSLVLPNIAYAGANATTWMSYGLEAQLGFQF
jgi:hypothetical protein